MLGVTVAVLLRALLAAGSDGTGSASEPSAPTSGLLQMSLGAMPEPPKTVVRVTRSFGTVTIDHPAHLARRAACSTCHGPGPVAKLTFTPGVAHERCVGCHRKEAKGPTACRECHVVKAPTPPVEVQAARTTKAEAVAGARPAPAPAAIPKPPPDAADLARSRAEADGFRRTLELGWAIASGRSGPAVRLTWRREDMLLTQSFERTTDSKSAHSLGTIGAGLEQPTQRRLLLRAEAIAGFDAVERPDPDFLPALGARIGVEWLPREWFFQSFHLSATGLVHGPPWRAGAGETVVVTLTTAFAHAR